MKYDFLTRLRQDLAVILNASDLLENLEEMFPQYYVHCDVQIFDQVLVYF